jgi:hypothetical protein
MSAAGQQPRRVEGEADNPTLQQRIQVTIVAITEIVKLSTGGGPETSKPKPDG